MNKERDDTIVELVRLKVLETLVIFLFTNFWVKTYSGSSKKRLDKISKELEDELTRSLISKFDSIIQEEDSKIFNQ